jgi:short-subunit dehydrogenase
LELRMSFSGKVVWITGASSGIGEALAVAMLDTGAQVILSGRRSEALANVAARSPERTFVLPFEGTDYAALPQVVERAWSWRGQVDALINNAGITQRSLAVDTDLIVYRRLMEVDYLAPVALTQLVLPHMIARRGGHIAVVSSAAGKVGAPLRTGYCGAKHAVIGYFEALRAEVEIAYGIQVSVILPGYVRTPIVVSALTGDGTPRGQSDVNIEEGMDANDAAQLMLAGLIEGKREIVVAQGLPLTALQMRTQDPEQLFGLLAQEGARLAALRDSLGGSAYVDPSFFRSMKDQ